MQKKFSFIFALILLATVSACSGTKSDSETPAEVGQQPQKVEVAPGQSTVPSSTPAPAPNAAPNSVPPSEKTVAPSESKQAASAAPETTKPKPAKQAPTEETPIPELSPENKKIVTKIAKEVKKEGEFLTQNAGVTTVNRILIAQQAMWLISGSFSTDFKTLEPNLPSETDEYRFEITQGDQSEAVVVAIAKSDKLPSFVGSTVAVPAGIPKSGVCQTKLPSQTPPAAPKIEQGQVLCGNDGVQVEIANP